MRIPLPAIGVLSFLGVACAPTAPEPEQTVDPPVILAAERGDLSALDQLLQSDAIVADTRDLCRWTPLMKAALNGHRDVVVRLLEADAAIDAADKGGYTALMLAASNNHAAVVEQLAGAGADLDRAEPGLGWTALIWAAKLGHADTVAVLLRAGADRALADSAGNRAKDWAEKNGHRAAWALLEGYEKMADVRP